MDLPIFSGDIVTNLSDAESQHALVLKGGSGILYGESFGDYFRISNLPEVFLFRDDCRMALIQGKNCQLVSNAGFPVGVLVGPTVLVPETITVSFLLTPFLGVGLLIEIPDLCGKTAVYQITAINGSSITLTFVSNEKGFDGQLGVYTPVFAVGFIPVASTLPPAPPLPPNVSPQTSGIVGTGTVVDNTLTASVTINSDNPIVVGQTYTFILNLPAPVPPPPSTVGLPTRYRELIYGQVLAITNATGVTIITAQTSTLNGTATLTTGAPIMPATVEPTFSLVGPHTYSLRATLGPSALVGIPVPAQVGQADFTYGQQVGVVTQSSPGTFFTINYGINGASLTPFDLIQDGTTMNTAIVQSVNGNSITVDIPASFFAGENVLFLTPPVEIGTVKTAVTSTGSSLSVNILEINIYTQVIQVTFYDSLGNTVTATALPNVSTGSGGTTLTLSNFSSPFSGTILAGQSIWQVIISPSTISAPVNGSSSSVTYPVVNKFSLPAGQPIVAVTSCQNISTGTIAGSVTGALTLASVPSPTANPNVTYKAGTPLYYAPNVQFNGQAIGSASLVDANTFLLTPLLGVYNLPLTGDKLILYDSTNGSVNPILVTSTNTVTYFFNSIAALTLGDSFEVLWETPTLIGWTTANSAGLGNAIVVPYATNGVIPISQNGGTVQILGQTYSVLIDNGQTLTLMGSTNQNDIPQYAPIVRPETNYPGLVALGTYSFNGVVNGFTAFEPINLNIGVQNGQQLAGTPLLTYNNQLANAYGTSCGGGIFTVEFNGDVAPPPGTGPLWVQDGFSGYQLLDGYSTASATSLGGVLQIPVNPGFTIKPSPAPSQFSFYDDTLAPQPSLSRTRGFPGSLNGNILTLTGVPVGVTIRPFTPIYQPAYSIVPTVVSSGIATGTNSASVSMTFVTAGSSIYVGVETNSYNIPSVSDSQGNVYKFVNGASNRINVYLFYSDNVVGGQDTINVTLGSSGNLIAEAVNIINTANPSLDSVGPTFSALPGVGTVQISSQVNASGPNELGLLVIGASAFAMSTTFSFGSGSAAILDQQYIPTIPGFLPIAGADATQALVPGSNTLTATVSAPGTTQINIQAFSVSILPP
jgi:hypothetical protein